MSSELRSISKTTTLETGIQIHHVEMGEGMPLVLLHGGGPGSSGANNYRLNYAFFAAQGYRVLMPDHVGWGKSSKPNGAPYDLELLAGSIERWLAHQGIEKCHLVGNSMGGAVALSLALDYPQLVERLVLLGPAGVTDPNVLEAMPGVHAFKTLGHLMSPEKISGEAIIAVLEIMVHDPSIIDAQDVAERLEVARTQPKDLYRNLKLNTILDRLTRIDHETLIFWGVRDTICPVESAYALLRACPASRLVAFSSCAHLVHVEAANAFNRLTADFLQNG